MSEKKTRQTIEVCRCFIPDKEGRFPIVKRALDSSYNPGLWEIPGGKIDEGESVSDAQRREAWEEVRLRIRASRTVFSSSRIITDPGKHFGKKTRTRFSINKIIGGKLRHSDEHTAIKLVTCAQFLEHEKVAPESLRAARYLRKRLS